MASFTAKDVQALRQSTGVGMLDAKKSLEENNGDMEKATSWLREHGIASAAKRSDREASQGAVSVVKDGKVAAIVSLRCETDFVAKATEFVALADAMAAKVAAEGSEAVEGFTEEIDQLRTMLKENISVGEVVRLEAGEDEVVDTYLHLQAGRGVNANIVILKHGTEELAHDVAVHVAFAKPLYARREDVPADEVAKERATVEVISRNEGKPEAALEKVIDGRMTGWFKERVLLEQPFAKDDKKSVAQILGDAELVAFAQVVVGA
jgi:elongation factor Ts